MELIVVADDLGYYPERDLIILDCFKKGIVRGSSLLINGCSAKSAAQIAKDNGLEIGLHINLTEGCPVSDPSLIPSLVRDYHDPIDHKDKKIFLGKFNFPQELHNNKINLDEVEIECRSQIELFKEYYGSYPVYADSHQHIHILPQLAPVFATLLEEYKIHYTRMLEDNEVESSFLKHDQRYLSHLDWYEKSHKVRSIYESHHVFCPLSIGMSISNQNMTIQRINNLLFRYPRQKDQVLVFEMMTHPSIPITCFQDTGCGIGADMFSQSTDRQHEYNILTSSYLKEILQDKQIRICSYSESHLSTTFKIPSIIPNQPRILLLSSMKESTGNTITCYRIYQYFLSLNYSVFIMDTTDNGSSDSLYALISRWNPSLIFAIHAYRSGRLLLDSRINTPMILILGGTDINCAINNEDKKGVIKNVFIKSKGIICFTDSMMSKSKQFIEENHILNAPLLYIIPQTVDVQQFDHDLSCLPCSLSITSLYSFPKNDIILMLPAGIRPVKNITFLFEALHQYDSILFSSHQQHIRLVISGPLLDIDYARNVFSYLPNENIYISNVETKQDILSESKQDLLYSNIYYHEPFSHAVLLSYLSSSFACLNSSDSEGQAAIVSESWYCGIPIIARDNEGNKQSIHNYQNGFLYHDPEDCIHILNTLINDNELYQSIINNGKKALSTFSVSDNEKQFYSTIASSLLKAI